jgi:hypothetical protein
MRDKDGKLIVDLPPKTVGVVRYRSDMLTPSGGDTESQVFEV